MGEVVVAEAHSAVPELRCPDCATASHRVHSRYRRRLAECPVGGRRVVVKSEVRRFFRDGSDCGRRTFVEQVEGLTTRCACAGPGVKTLWRSVALAAGGRPGMRLCRSLTPQCRRRGAQDADKCDLRAGMPGRAVASRLRCGFSASMPYGAAVTCRSGRCLTPCPPWVVSTSWHFPLGHGRAATCLGERPVKRIKSRKPARRAMAAYRSRAGGCGPGVWWSPDPVGAAGGAGGASVRRMGGLRRTGRGSRDAAVRLYEPGPGARRRTRLVAVVVALARAVTGGTAPGGSPQASRLSSR
ncbi:transposase family protein [Streptomyces fulvoviolaceus]|uniref:transposase family protein n=1 Tax=Streptomyces fulvoviolaceus TaxID=285535 RepID=UPI0030B81FF0